MNPPTGFRRWRSILPRLYGLGSGSALLLSAHYHLASPLQFLQVILDYRLTDPTTSWWLTLILPCFFIVLGTWLLVGIYPRESLWLAALSFSLLTVVQWSAVSRGLSIECGCFGPVSHLVSNRSVLVMALVSALGWVSAYDAQRQSH